MPVADKGKIVVPAAILGAAELPLARLWRSAISIAREKREAQYWLECTAHRVAPESTQVGFTRLARIYVPISGKPEIGVSWSLPSGRAKRGPGGSPRTERRSPPRRRPFGV